VTSFFEIKGTFFSNTTRRICVKFFLQGLVENICSLQPILKSNALGLYVDLFFSPKFLFQKPNKKKIQHTPKSMTMMQR